MDEGMVMTKVQGMEGVYRFSVRMLESIPAIEWDNFYNLVLYTGPARL